MFTSGPKIIYSLLLAFVLSWMIPDAGCGQTGKYVVHGKVVSKTDDNPLVGTNVYLSNTLYGASTDRNGSYVIKNIPRGVYDLTFSFVGFEPVVKQIVFDGSKDSLRVDVALNSIESEMDELVVQSDRPDKWMKLKSIFEREFLGYSRNAKDTRILNPEYLDFQLDDNIFTAEASRPLIVENRAMGYKLYVELNSFKWNLSTKTGNMIYYPKYEIMETDSRRTRKKWERTRNSTFEGSLKHFFVHLYRERAEHEGYVFTRGLIKEISGNQKEFELSVRKDLPKRLKTLLKGYRLPKEIQIKYNKNRQNTSGLYGSNTSYKISSIAPNTNTQIFFIDPWGNLLDPNSIKLGGEWASNRVADFLPFHYGVD